MAKVTHVNPDISNDGAVLSSQNGAAKPGLDIEAEPLAATDEQLFRLIRQSLYVPVICDVLDSVGYRQQAMNPRLRPLLPSPADCGFAGRARTLRWMETDYVVEEDPYGLEIEALDTIRPGHVVVHSTDARGVAAPWGELVSTVAMRNGAVGCVCDAMARDCLRIIELGFPVFCAGVMPVDSKGRCRVMAYDVPIKCGDVLVRPGDIIVADYDGVVVIPEEVERTVLRLAFDKVLKENRTRTELQEGRRLRDVFDKYGVL